MMTYSMTYLLVVSGTLVGSLCFNMALILVAFKITDLMFLYRCEIVIFLLTFNYIYYETVMLFLNDIDNKGYGFLWKVFALYILVKL